MAVRETVTMLLDIRIIIVSLLFFFILIAAKNTVYADEIYYPIGSSPLTEVHPFAGETFYPEGPPFTTFKGMNFWLYNDASGKLEMNLQKLLNDNMYVSPPVISPDFNHIVYTEVYYYPSINQVTSRCFYIPVNLPKENPDGTPVTLKEYLKSYSARSDQHNRYDILSVGTSTYDRDVFRSLTIVDWDYTSTRVLIKEKIGRMRQGVIGSIIWFYDIIDDKIVRLDTIREAIINYWLNNKDLDLNQYSWDIEVLGWEMNSDTRFIVNAYAYPAKGKKIFLGCWSMDIKSQLAKLLSLDNENWEVARNGLITDSY